MLLDGLAEKFGGTFKSNAKFSAELAEVQISKNRILLIKPQTFMNRSGESVAAVGNFYKFLPSEVLVIYDDLDLPLGKLRIRSGGSSGGHNGIKSIAELMGTQDFPRVRIGIGKPEGQRDAADWVLEKFSAIEKQELGKVLEDAVAAVEILIESGLTAAQAKFN